MTIDPSGALIIAIAWYAVSWTARIQGPPRAINVIAWTISALGFLALAAVWF